MASGNGGYIHSDGNRYYAWDILQFFNLYYSSNIPGGTLLDFTPFVNTVELIAKYYMGYTFEELFLSIQYEDSEYRYKTSIKFKDDTGKIESIEVFSKIGSEPFFMNSKPKDLMQYSSYNIYLLTRILALDTNNINALGYLSEIIMYYINIVN